MIVRFVLRIRPIPHKHAAKPARNLALYLQGPCHPVRRRRVRRRRSERIAAGPGLNVRSMTLKAHRHRRMRPERPDAAGQCSASQFSGPCLVPNCSCVIKDLFSHSDKNTVSLHGYVPDLIALSQLGEQLPQQSCSLAVRQPNNCLSFSSLIPAKTGTNRRPLCVSESTWTRPSDGDVFPMAIQPFASKFVDNLSTPPHASLRVSQPYPLAWWLPRVQSARAGVPIPRRRPVDLSRNRAKLLENLSLETGRDQKPRRALMPEIAWLPSLIRSHGKRYQTSTETNVKRLL